jgi:hypothetical protein
MNGASRLSSVAPLPSARLNFNERSMGSRSVARKPEDNLAFAVADTLFAKYGLKPIQRKQTTVLP